MLGPSQPMNKRYAYLFIAIGATLVISLILTFRGQAQGTRHPDYIQEQAELDAKYSRPRLSGLAGSLGGSQPVMPHAIDYESPVPISKAGPGVAIAEKLGNETIKAELGRAAWKLFHTTFARFPDKPTADESSALESYIYLFQRLYPCGECATHFGKILEEYPPQVSSRSSAAAWGCHVHNEVNKSLRKDLFDCSNIGDFYDCGCKETEDDDEDDDDDRSGKHTRSIKESALDEHQRAR